MAYILYTSSHFPCHRFRVACPWHSKSATAAEHGHVVSCAFVALFLLATRDSNQPQHHSASDIRASAIAHKHCSQTSCRNDSMLETGYYIIHRRRETHVLTSTQSDGNAFDFDRLTRSCTAFPNYNGQCSDLKMAVALRFVGNLAHARRTEQSCRDT
jgi:hypothetical protein